MNMKSFCSGNIFSLLLWYFPLPFVFWSDVEHSHVDPLGFLFVFSTSLFSCSTSQRFPRSDFPTFLSNYFPCWQIDLYYLGGISWCAFIPFSLENACCMLQHFPKSLWECTLEFKFPPALCMTLVSSRIMFCICPLWCLFFRPEALPLEDLCMFMLKNKSIKPDECLRAWTDLADFANLFKVRPVEGNKWIIPWWASKW